MQYKHPCPRQSAATAQQVASFKAFVQWRALLDVEMLHFNLWISFHQKTAQVASLIKWTEWIHEGHASGLRRQHRFSRTSHG